MHVDEATFRGLLEAAPDAIVGVGLDGRIVLVNGQTERLFGYSRQELLGELIEILVPTAARAVHPNHREGYATSPVTRPMGAGMELAGRRKDGTEFPAEISLSAIDTPGGLIFSAAIRDASDRKRAEAKFRGLLEAAPDAIVGVDRDGRIALVNAQAERLFGYGRQDLLGESVDILVPEHVRDVHPRWRGEYFSDPQPRPMGAGMELAGRRKDGTEFPAEISLSAIETEEGLLVSAAIRDVTDRIEVQAERERLRAQAERERMESQMHQSQRLESLGQLAGGVAHDFNNLLAVILSYTEFVTEQIDLAASGDRNVVWEDVERDLAQVRRAARRATDLTHQLLAFGRREVVKPQPLNLNDVVVSIEQLLRRTIGEHLVLSIATDPELWSVMADPGQIEQVLVNLAVNSRDAMPGGGTLTIETNNVVADEAYASVRPEVDPGNYARVRVSDTGTGMSSEILAHIFEPFFTTKPKGEGSGLGLATVYGIIKQAGGHAQIYSEEGIGTTFSALFPVTDLAAQPVLREEDVVGVGGGETVLVVEDEDAMREVTRRILTRHGHTVLTASTGTEAIALARRHQGDIDVLLTDVIMPNMLGKEVAARIVAVRPSTVVVYMSGYAQPILTSKGTLESGVSLIEKPFSEAQLISVIRDAVVSRRFGGEDPPGRGDGPGFGPPFGAGDYG